MSDASRLDLVMPPAVLSTAGHAFDFDQLTGDQRRNVRERVEVNSPGVVLNETRVKGIVEKGNDATQTHGNVFAGLLRR